ncbi:sugar porter family MFS transporter [Edaphobacter modestus]|uniref:Sugar porter (SP) family MFS transporter n=1 Tax=Edaphobacter modestus TaxID=388466 RepID=A0A4Q7YW50_9BACT|nr:sugar porter family MFS transporter [Edaphobacter modestus]RZU41910.1 sugar porter (SP) family MFS transporter [Edaphobacter modestus]
MADSINASDIQVNRGFLWRVSFISGLGGILYGYDMGIIAAALIFIRGSFALSTRMQELVVSIVLIGAMLGAIIGGGVADRIGRRATLLWGGCLFVVGSILAQLSPNIMTLMAARALLGLAIGFTSVTAPVYISELSPPQSRGRLISLYQFALTLGIALANVVGYWLAAGQAWRTMFGLGVLPAVLFLILVLTLPESPRWLFSVGRMEQAHSVLRTYTNEAGGRLLLEDIQSALQAKVDKRWSSLWSPAARGALVVAVGFTVLQQVTGINTIIYYGPQIFSLAGITADKSAIFATLIVAVTNMVFTVVAMVLVDRLGRKPLLYAGVGGMTVSLFVLAYAFHHQELFRASLGAVATACLVFYIACFAFSMGPIAWILVSEVFPLQVRARGVAAATIGSGASNFVVSATFLSLIKSAGNAATFATYGFFCIVTLFFVRFIVPETKGRELESISTKTADAA